MVQCVESGLSIQDRYVSDVSPHNTPSKVSRVGLKCSNYPQSSLFFNKKQLTPLENHSLLLEFSAERRLNFGTMANP